MVRYRFRREELPVFVGHGCSTELISVDLTNICRLRLTKFYYCFRFFAPGMYDTSYLIMQHVSAGYIVSLF